MRHFAGPLFVTSLCFGLLSCNAVPPQAHEALPRSSSSIEAAHPRVRNHATTAPGFDFYLLNLSWSPEYCATHASAAECASHSALVLHGLWPQNSDGTYPQHCSTAPGPTDPAAYADLFPDAGLLAHEWQTHGTCSGLSADAYFNLARQALHEVKTPPALTGLTRQVSVAPPTLIDDVLASNSSFPNTSIAVSCGGNYLTAIEVCLSKTLQPIACQSINSCRASTIRVVPPGASSASR